jgi:hypothetical protein
MDYYTEIQNLEKELNSSNKNKQQLSVFQSRLNGLMLEFREDESLSEDRYALYQVQAMLSYRLGDYGKAKKFIDYAVEIRGKNFKLASELNKHLMEQDFEPKSERKWWWLIFSPISALIIVALLQVIVHFVLNNSSNSGSSPAITLVNIISIIVGVIAVVLLLLLPIWIIELISTRKYNDGHGYSSGLRKRTGILIAVFFCTWYWAYTWQVNKGKFWLNFILGFSGYWFIVAWPWAIIYASTKPEEFYALYPYYKDLPKTES